MADTIYALASGAAPAAIAILRVSGPDAGAAVTALSGGKPLPPARRAALRRLSDPVGGEALDEALVLWFPGPNSVTGEDLAELHCHGGRAVIRAIEAALDAFPSLRQAEPGEFTRRALAAGRIDLTQAEGLGDLLAAETEGARRAALEASEGGIRRKVERWTDIIVALAASIEAVLDHSDEDDVSEAHVLDDIRVRVAGLHAEIAGLLDNPTVERLHDGVRVVLAGPPNAGKSTLLNALADRDAAIVSPIAGTTRDRIEVAVQRRGVAYQFIDTAGLAAATDDPIEAIGIERARSAAATADILLWLGDGAAPKVGGSAEIVTLHARCDVAARDVAPPGRLAVSAATGAGLDALWSTIEEAASKLIPRTNSIALNRRQQRLCAIVADELAAIGATADALLIGEHLRAARGALDRITGRADVEAMLDALFSRFCIGK